MSEEQKRGSIGWHDLTVKDAPGLRDFYQEVVGWGVEEVDMGDYADYSMTNEDGPVAGVCHARGVNEGIPPQWILYVIVDDLDGRIERCRQHGGEVVSGPREMGPARFCIIRDPAGAVLGLYQPG